MTKKTTGNKAVTGCDSDNSVANFGMPNRAIIPKVPSVAIKKDQAARDLRFIPAVISQIPIPVTKQAIAKTHEASRRTTMTTPPRMPNPIHAESIVDKTNRFAFTGVVSTLDIGCSILLGKTQECKLLQAVKSGNK